jgi:hypothetical protein
VASPPRGACSAADPEGVGLLWMLMVVAFFSGQG